MLNFYLLTLKLSKFIDLKSITQWFTTLMLAIFILLSLPTWAALQAELQPGAIKVTNHQALENVEVYLVWFDINADPIKDSARSWQFEKQDWQSGILPVFADPINLPAIEAYTIQFQSSECPQDHGCFLALVVTKPNQNPVNTQSWLDSVVIPLSASANCERLPGQQSFLSCGSSLDRSFTLDSVDKATAMPTATEESSNADGAQAETEKPDIFKLVGKKILYANSAAKVFQVIDIADLMNPKLVGKQALAGRPHELYVRDNFYVLLQSDYDYSQPQGANTRLTTLRQEPDGQITLLQDLTLAGSFSESRRRNEVIYVVTQQTIYVDCPETVPCSSDDQADVACTSKPVCISHQNTVNITAFRWEGNGQLSEVDKDSLPGYTPVIAIFPNYLVIANHHPEEPNWRTTQIQAVDLSQPNDNLVKTCLFQVPGQVPTEFHLDVFDKYLRVVYGPENRDQGSNLAIYDLSTCSSDPVGEVSNIAPGENLFGTRFTADQAFVITAVRKDPLWVIDISNPQEPKIMGELEVPGWSEKLFFHEDRLFTVGIDQPLPEQPTDEWWSLVALSLFDVANPTQPTLIKRIVPLKDQVSYSYSPAVDDERALLLDWGTEQVAALPINSWENEAKNILQIISLANDNLTDVGYVDSPVSLQRATVIDDNRLAALGDQILLTLSWGLPPVKPAVLGKLELATNLSWLKHQDGKLWAGVFGNNGYYRICRYNPTDLENPAKCWDLSKGYNNLVMDKQAVVAYNYNPLAIQALNITNEQLGVAQELEKIETKPTDTSSAPPIDMIIMPEWYQRYVLVHDQQFCVIEQRPVKREPQPQDHQDNWQTHWSLRCWNLSNAQEVPAYSIPGQPIQQNTFTANGELITREDTIDGQIRFNKVALEDGQAKLLFSQEFPCYSSSIPVGTGEYIYMNCEEEPNFWPTPDPIFIDEPVVAVKAEKGDEVITVEPDVVVTAEGSTENTNNTKEEVPPEPDPTTVILKLNVSQNFTEECRWTLSEPKALLAAIEDVIVVSPAWGWWRYPISIEPAILDVDAKIMPIIEPPAQYCEVYRLICGQEPQLLKQLETCPGSDTVALTPDIAWMAEGFAGIKAIQW